jgi:MFS family permease
MVLALTGSPALAGIGTSILALSRVVIAYPLGALTDTHGRKPGMLLSLLLGLAGSLLLAASLLTSSFPLFLIGMIVIGLGIGGATQLRTAATDMYPPARRGEGLGYLLTGSLLGIVGAPFIIAAAQALSPSLEIDPMALAWLMSPIFILPAFFLLMAIRPDPKTIGQDLQRYWPDYRPPAPRAEAATAVKTSGLGMLTKSYPRLTAYIAMAAAQGSMSMMMAMTAIVLEHHNHSLQAISISVTAHALAMFAFSIPLGKLADRIGRKTVLTAGVIVSAIGALGVPLTADYFVITFSTFLVGLGWSAANMASTALIADTTAAEERGQAIGVGDTLAASFNVITPISGTLLIGFLGLIPIGVIGAAFMAVPLAMLLRVREYGVGVYAAEPAAPVGTEARSA